MQWRLHAAPKFKYYLFVPLQVPKVGLAMVGTGVLDSCCITHRKALWRRNHCCLHTIPTECWKIALFQFHQHGIYFHMKVHKWIIIASNTSDLRTQPQSTDRTVWHTLPDSPQQPFAPEGEKSRDKVGTLLRVNEINS